MRKIHRLQKYSAVLTSVVVVAFMLASTCLALDTPSYQKGLVFGQTYQSEILSNITELKAKASENDVDLAQALRYAKDAEALYLNILPEKVAWMQGVAEGAAIPYEDILMFNTVDKLITGFIGECTTFMAHGTALEAGAGVIIAKNRDLGSQTLSEVDLHQAARYPEGSVYKAAYIDIPQAEETYKFVGSRTAGRWGYGMGVNEHQVLVSDNDAPSRDELGFTASLHDNDLVRIVLERAKTAREAVDVIGSVVSEYGQAWNGIIFEVADPNELWVVEITGKRWAAKQYTDTVTARSNQYQIEDDYDLAADDLVSFAVSQGWVPEGTERINFKEVYSTDVLYPEDNDLSKRNNIPCFYQAEVRYNRAMELLQGQLEQLTAEKIMAFCRDHYDTYTLPSGKVIEMNQIPFYSSEYADLEDFEFKIDEPQEDYVPMHMYIRSICSHDRGWGTTASSAILVARPNVPNELGLMLHAYVNPCNSTYVPFYVGIDSLDYRYSTPEAAVAFQSIMTRAFTKYGLYHDAIRKAFAPYEAQLFQEMPQVESQFQELVSADKLDEAVAMLTQFVKDKSVQAYNLVQVAQDNMTQAAYDASKWSR